MEIEHNLSKKRIKENNKKALKFSQNQTYYNRYISSLYNVITNKLGSFQKNYFNRKSCLDIGSREGVQVLVLCLIFDIISFTGIERNEGLVYKSLRNYRCLSAIIENLNLEVIKDEKNNDGHLSNNDEFDLLEDLKKECGENRKQSDTFNNNSRIKSSKELILKSSNHNIINNVLIQFIERELIDNSQYKLKKIQTLPFIEFKNTTLKYFITDQKYDVITCFDHFDSFWEISITEFFDKAICLLNNNGILILEIDSRVDYFDKCRINKDKDNFTELKKFLSREYGHKLYLINELYISCNSNKGYDKPILVYQKIA